MAECIFTSILAYSAGFSTQSPGMERARPRSRARTAGEAPQARRAKSSSACLNSGMAFRMVASGTA